MPASKFSESASFESVLLFRKEQDSAIITWKSTCIFHDVKVERCICEKIDSAAIPAWILVLQDKKNEATSLSDLKILKQTNAIVLIFLRTFLQPNSIILDKKEQIQLSNLLNDVLKAHPDLPI